MYEYLLEEECLLEAQTLQPHLERLGTALDAVLARLETSQGAEAEELQGEADQLRRTLPGDYGRWEQAARGMAPASTLLRRAPKLDAMRQEIEAAHGLDKVRSDNLVQTRSWLGIFDALTVYAIARTLNLQAQAWLGQAFLTSLPALARQDLAAAIRRQAEAQDVHWCVRGVDRHMILECHS